VDTSEYVKRVAIALGITALAGTVVWGLFLARDALLLIYVSALLAIGFGPVVRAVEHQKRIPIGTRRLPRWLAILVVYLVIIGAFILVAMLIVPPIVRQGGELWERLPAATERAQQFLVDRGVLDRAVTLEEAVRQAPQASAGTAVGTAAVAVGWTAGFIFDCIMVLILTFYLLVESEAIFAGISRLVARENRSRVVDASRQISTKVSAWLTGQLILSFTIGSSAAVALWALGVPYFYVLALIAAVGEMIPVIGPFLSAVPAILVAFTVSTPTAIWVAIFWLVQQQVENNLLVPKIMERQVGVSPVVVIVALMIGGSMLGVIGAILAVPTAAILQVVILEVLERRERPEAS
jgi:predicted PurR-regulated permease PerM